MTHPSISVSMAPNAPSVSLSRVYIRGGVLAMRAAVADSPQYDLNDRDFALTGYEGSTMLLERIGRVFAGSLWDQVSSPAPWEVAQ